MMSYVDGQKEARGKIEGPKNEGQNNKVAAAFKAAQDKFYSKTNRGRFLALISKDPESQEEALSRLSIPVKKRYGFIESLKKKGFIDIKEDGNTVLVTKIHNEKIDNAIEEKLYDKRLLGFIKKEEHQGMNVAMITFYTKERSIKVLGNKIKKLVRLELIVDAQPVNKPSRYYFSPDFVIKGYPEQTKIKRIEAIREREEEFKEVKIKSKIVDPSNFYKNLSATRGTNA